MKLSEIKNFTVLGAGTLGLRVGLQAAISGFEVKIYDISENSFKSAKITQQKLLHHFVKEGVIKEEINSIISRISFTTNASEAARDADFINESVTEDLEVKKKVWKQFGELCPEKTIFTTNTSYLLPSMLAESTGRPEQFCAFHFHDVFFANVVDVMPHPSTNHELVEMLKEMGKKLNQIPVVVEKENHGYLFNFMLMAILGSAANLVMRGISSHQDVDKSWMGNFKMPIGPFGIMDEIGLETAWHVCVNQKDAKSQKFAEFLKTYLDQGKLGVKSGEGFYSYPNPEFKNVDFLN